jgi:hypothetical protein
VQVDQRGTLGIVAHAFHQFTRVSAFASHELIARVAKVVEVDLSANSPPTITVNETLTIRSAWPGIRLRGCCMTIGATLLTGVIAALAGGVGVVAGALVTNRAQDHQWLRDQQLAAYRDLLGHYANFSMEISRAHQDRRGWDYDWGSWSTSLVSASLVAPDHVATCINDFGGAVQVLLDAAAARSSIEDPLTLDDIRRALAPAAKAQVTLVNAMRDSLGMHEPLAAPVGGTPVRTLCKSVPVTCPYEG